MTVGELKNVTKKDLLDYKADFESNVKPSYEEDYATVSVTNTTMQELCVEVYGSESKQHKYLYRNFSKGENIADLHYNMFPSPTELDVWVENSQSGFYEDYCIPAKNYARKEDK